MTSPDLLRRFTPTPLAARMGAMRRTIGFETNSAPMLERTRAAFSRLDPVGAVPAEFQWRIVAEAGAGRGLGSGLAAVAAYSDGTLSFVGWEGRGFVAVDRESRLGVGFLDDRVAQDEPGLWASLLQTLFSLSAPALGLAPLRAACVEKDGKGFLVFGPSSILEEVTHCLMPIPGLRAYADHTVFVDLGESRLSAWAQLRQVRLPGEPVQPAESNENDGEWNAGSAFEVSPVGCVFLEAQPLGTPRLTQVGHAEANRRLAASRILEGDECESESKARLALGRLPAYLLGYGAHPRDAALFIRALVANQHLQELQP